MSILILAEVVRQSDRRRPSGKVLQQLTVVRLDNLGDHVLGMGLIGALRDLYPSAQLLVVVPEDLVGLYARSPWLCRILPLPRREAYLRDPLRFRELLQSLRAESPAQCVINPRFAEDYYLAGPICRALAGSPARIVGFRQITTPYAGYDPNAFYTELIEAPDGLHASRYANLLAGHFGANGAIDPIVWYASEDRAAVRSRYRLDSRPFVVLGCGASLPYKRPSLKTYRYVVEQLVIKFDRRILLTGVAADRPTADAIIAAAPGGATITSTVGELTLPELAALLSDAELYVGPDSGPMHIAAAAGTAVLELGWVPEDYPRTSRGDSTAGHCWAPWTARAKSIRPDPAQFAGYTRNQKFWQQPIPTLPEPNIDAACAALLGGTR